MSRQLLAVLLLISSLPAAAQFTDVIYATAEGGKELGLDIHLPAGSATPALVVYVHGGAWNAGSKAQYPKELVAAGFAVASVDFRQTSEAPFPANVHDIKAAIRFLRAHAGKYGYRAERIAIVGASSGGHLAALVGVTNAHAELEGKLGDHLHQSSSVQAIVSYFGASNLTTILGQSTPHGLSVRKPALERLLGALPENAPELARLASPVFHIDGNDPPLLLLHGDQDAQMPVNQSLELQGAYQKAGLDVNLHIAHGVGHVGEPFFTGEPLQRVLDFLRKALGSST